MLPGAAATPAVSAPAAALTVTVIVTLLLPVTQSKIQAAVLITGAAWGSPCCVVSLLIMEG